MTMQMQIYTSAQKFNLVTWWPDSHGNDKTHTNASNTSQGEIESNLVNTFENRQFLKDDLENYEAQGHQLSGKVDENKSF